MEEKINLDSINWTNANAIWLYPIIQEYARTGKDLGMDYLSLGSLRYNEKYFVGYIYNQDNIDCPIDLVAYIQYKMIPGRLIINYVERANQYRGNGIAERMIDEFVERVITNTNISVDITTLSHDGRKANLVGKFQERINGDVTETSKRNTL